MLFSERRVGRTPVFTKENGEHFDVERIHTWVHHHKHKKRWERERLRFQVTRCHGES